ncbi:MAG TPA: glycoside hydrolase family 15 protein, partial [Nitrospiria bacterium]|nr:glycoside hydrolase family 15 protein [Nitrospiria bacterium]
GKDYDLDCGIDISLLGLVTLGGFSPKDPRILKTIEAVRKKLWLKTPVGGCARYENDNYQRPKDGPKDIPGNPWFISTLWLGEYFIASAQNLQELHKALPYIEWCASSALPSGVFAEQVHPVTGSPLSVSPLTWSHSAFVWAVLQYSEAYDRFQNS